MNSKNKESLFKWLKQKSVFDWLESSAPYGDSWEEWVITSLRELNGGVDNLVLFGPEISFIMDNFNIINPSKIQQLLIEFYNKELEKIKNGETEINANTENS